MDYRCKSPVLFLVFNRPDVTKRVFEAIRQARPSRLYVAADGARPDRVGEAERCKQVREIATAVDWSCEVKTLLRDENLGCGRAVSEAITWFFKNVEEGIVLEDDCLPSGSFFRFCDELLERYRNDDRIGLISGSYSLPTNITPNDESYFLARYGRIWGWASWGRAWSGYDLEIKFWPKLKELQSHRCFFECSAHADHYERIWDHVFAGDIDTWDYQWDLKRLAELRFTLVSTENLISNLGFNGYGTHTTGDTASTRRSLSEVSFPLVHPEPLFMDFRRDRETHGLRFGSSKLSLRRWVIKFLRFFRFKRTSN
jgi:hypothetical protein